jgi:hypothetical protein
MDQLALARPIGVSMEAEAHVRFTFSEGAGGRIERADQLRLPSERPRPPRLWKYQTPAPPNMM